MVKLRNAWLPLLLTSVAASAQWHGVSAKAQANYEHLDGGTHEDVIDFPAASLPATALARSYVPIGGPTGMGRSDRVTAYDDADAFARVSHPGVEQLYARVGGWSPQGGSPDHIRARASVTVASKWAAVGAPGNMVPVDLNYFLDGWLYVGKGGGPNDGISASHSFSITVVLEDGSGHLILGGGGHLNHANGFVPSFHSGNGWSDSVWTAAWTDTSSTLENLLGTDAMWDLNYSEVIPTVLLVEANKPFTLNYSAYSSADNFAGAVEAGATSDFSNTSGYGLSTSMPGYEMREIDLVPEPATLCALAMGVGLVFGRNRTKRA